MKNRHYSLGTRCKACDEPLDCGDEELCAECLTAATLTLCDSLPGLDEALHGEEDAEEE